MKSMHPSALKGVCEFFSETGTEGGYWAFMDENGIHKTPPETGLFPNAEVYHREKPELRGRVITAKLPDGRPIPDPMNKDDLRWADLAAAKEKWGRDPYGIRFGTPTVNTVEWEDGSVSEDISSEDVLVLKWEYESLHTLKDGDELTILDKDGAVYWHGTIKLIDRGLFREDAFGMWIHNDQEGVDREFFALPFMEGWSATLRKGDG